MLKLIFKDSFCIKSIFFYKVSFTHTQTLQVYCLVLSCQTCRTFSSGPYSLFRASKLCAAWCTCCARSNRTRWRRTAWFSCAPCRSAAALSSTATTIFTTSRTWSWEWVRYALWCRLCIKYLLQSTGCSVKRFDFLIFWKHFNAKLNYVFFKTQINV